jgi:large subunit ribosomal protein L17
MRHGKKVNHLGRKTAHRRSMLANMACSLIEHKRINTTVAKAKALKQFVEPLVTKSKEDTTHNRRIVFSRLRQKEAVTELFRDVAVKVGDRPGGYTRIIKLGNRLGDNADMAMIELVDYNEVYNANKPAKKKSTRRAGKGKKADEAVAKAAPAEKLVDAPVADATPEVTEEVKKEETPEAAAPEISEDNNQEEPKNDKE